MNKKKIVSSISAAGFLALLSTTAVADDKSFPGGVCFQTGTSGTLARFGGSILNSSSTSELSVQCPVVRDNPAQTFAANQIAFDVFDRNGAGISVACNLCNEVGTAAGISTSCSSVVTSAAGASTGVQTLLVPTPPGNLGGAQYSYATCSIPRSHNGQFSHLARVWFNEP